MSSSTASTASATACAAARAASPERERSCQGCVCGVVAEELSWMNCTSMLKLQQKENRKMEETWRRVIKEKLVEDDLPAAWTLIASKTQKDWSQPHIKEEQRVDHRNLKDLVGFLARFGPQAREDWKKKWSSYILNSVHVSLPKMPPCHVLSVKTKMFPPAGSLDLLLATPSPNLLRATSPEDLPRSSSEVFPRPSSEVLPRPMLALAVKSFSPFTVTRIGSSWAGVSCTHVWTPNGWCRNSMILLHVAQPITSH